MLKQLRKKLVFLYTGTTGLILAAVMIGILLLNSNHAERSTKDTFQSHLLSIITKMQSEISISGSWLAVTESENNLLIHIENNRVPLKFNGSWEPPTPRQTLILRAQEIASLENVKIDIQPVSAAIVRSSIFKFEGAQHEPYYGSVTLLKTRSGYNTLTLIHQLDSKSGQITRDIFTYISFYLIGLAAIGFFSWKFVDRSLRPVEVSGRKQTEFIAAASHELRSPLAVIQTGLSTLALSAKDQRVVEMAQRECRRMSRLINDMLLLASADAKTWSLHMGNVDVDTLMIENYEAFLPMAAEKGQTISLDLPEEVLPNIHGDAERLSQLLSILTDNAISYTPDNKSVFLKASLHDNWLILSVEDEGCGIPDHKKDQVFERFYRGDQARNEKKHFGLGLSIAKELVELHGGKIKVTDGTHGGVCFQVWLRPMQ